jgi:hypothetical protein
MAALGLALSKDSAGWMRPLSYAVLGAVVIGLLVRSWWTSITCAGTRPRTTSAD